MTKVHWMAIYQPEELARMLQEDSLKTFLNHQVERALRAHQDLVARGRNDQEAKEIVNEEILAPTQEESEPATTNQTATLLKQVRSYLSD
ncbi:MAG: hypothetical protein INR73_19060 [Williamsia sp.]|nr:hypothetical protein [Williamsia sp.]